MISRLAGLPPQYRPIRPIEPVRADFQAELSARLLSFRERKDRGLYSHKKSPRRTGGFFLKLSSDLRRVVHLELDRVGGVFEVINFFPLELHVGINRIIIEDVAFFEEVTVCVQCI